jgi:hypothetical protein
MFIYICILLPESYSFVASEYLLIKPVCFGKTETIIKAAEVENFDSFK